MDSTVTLAIKYSIRNKFSCIPVVYIMVSIFLMSFFNVDICIPCLWKTITGFDCPGCGLTTAMIKLIKFDPAGAYQSNKLIFVVIPIAFFCAWRDFLKFKKTQIADNGAKAIAPVGSALQ